MRAVIKLRTFPGHIGRASRIEMLEDSKNPEYRSKGWKKDLVKEANRRQRHEKIKY